jgi:acetyl-CoA carboxylase biotin carboxyl carrier protein
LRVSEKGSTNADETLDAVCRNVMQLCAGVHGPLRRIGVRSGEVAVEVEWPDGRAAPGELSTPSALQPVSGEAHSDEPDTLLHYISAPMVGTFYRAPEPGAKPFVREGDMVEKDQQVGILEAMKLMNPIEADQPGRVVQILVPDATAVEYGQRLIAIALSES